jgi:hypothetical protein
MPDTTQTIAVCAAYVNHGVGVLANPIVHFAMWMMATPFRLLFQPTI